MNVDKQCSHVPKFVTRECLAEQRRHPRSIRVTQSEHSSSTFSFYFEPLYLRLLYSRIHEGLRSAGEVLSHLDADQLPDKQSSTRRVRSDMNSHPEPERSSFPFIFVTSYLRMFSVRVFNECEHERSAMIEGDYRVAKTSINYDSFLGLVSNEAEAESLEDGGENRACHERSLWERYVELGRARRGANPRMAAREEKLSKGARRVPSAKAKRIDRDGQFEAVRQHLVPRLCPPESEQGGRQWRSNEVSDCTHRSRRPIFEAGLRVYRLKVTAFVIVRTCATSRCFVSSSEQVANEDGRLEVARRHLAQGLRPPDEAPDGVPGEV
ncbi:hypothetical protein F5J12DRAFT_238955 [Pisolithus orientalis]|uniref:uncharacterized protein n=1 Tax=Pisolithus orientalis TaxID=936130 RepID=UPI0022246930|nr:uncharacterized protein F5J12DRAFT_238955 [Pisolithus orientalis]KAI6001614.1 hypothetical protein F5J12DRAFT_238955 [Pisolithus orientalis]